MPEYQGLPFTKTRERRASLQRALAAVLPAALWLAAPAVAQVRHIANARVSASLDELARQPRAARALEPRRHPPPAFGISSVVDNFRVMPPDTQGAVGPKHVKLNNSACNRR